MKFQPDEPTVSARPAPVKPGHRGRVMPPVSVQAAETLLTAFLWRTSVDQAAGLLAHGGVEVTDGAVDLARSLDLGHARLAAVLREQFRERFDAGALFDVELHLVAHSSVVSLLEATLRFRQLGFAIATPAPPIVRLRRLDRQIMSRSRSGHPPWRRHGEVLRAVDVALLAVETRVPAKVVARDAARLGLLVTPPAPG